jgi:hypothetical protein
MTDLLPAIALHGDMGRTQPIEVYVNLTEELGRKPALSQSKFLAPQTL